MNKKKPSLASELEDLKRQVAALRSDIAALGRYLSDGAEIRYYPALGTGNACNHVYPSPWFGIHPPACLKCHQ